MRQDAKEITPESIDDQDAENRRRLDDYLKAAERCRADSSRNDRLGAGLCRCCYYLRTPRIAGHAITERPCGACGELKRYASTATDALCPECARELQLCRQCGGHLYGR